MHKHCKGYRCLKLSKEENALLRSKNGNVAFDWVGNLTTGVWLIRITESGIVDHCVCVDGARNLIYDSEEEYPVQLGSETFRLCGGALATKPRIAEVRRIVSAKSNEE